MTHKILDEHVDLMAKLVVQTKSDGRERGFSVCKNNEGYKVLPVCVGDRRCVNIEKCDWHEMFLQFHTHPKESNRLLSYADMKVVLAEEPDYLCVGYAVRGKKHAGWIRCYKVNRGAYKSKEVQDLLSEMRRREAGEIISSNSLMHINALAIVGESDLLNEAFNLFIENDGVW